MKLSKQEIEARIAENVKEQQTTTDWEQLHRLQAVERRYELMLLETDRPEAPVRSVEYNEYAGDNYDLDYDAYGSN